MKEERQNHPCFTGVPNFFRACVADASAGNGESNYSIPGTELARHTYRLLPDDDCEAMDRCYEELIRLLRAGDAQGVLRWYDTCFPKCMELIPPRRRTKFAEGIIWAFEEDIME